MTLTSEETAILTAYLTNHGIITYVFPAGDNDRLSHIRQWLNTVPNVNDYDDDNVFTGLKNILHALTFTEKKDIFGYENASNWYHHVLSLISDGTITDTLAKKYSDIFSQKAHNSNLLNFAFNEFLSRVIRSKDLIFLNQIFYLMFKQGLLSQSSLDKITIEFMPFKRYVNINLASLPDLIELENILNSIET